mgnify:CR=1 FL=1
MPRQFFYISILTIIVALLACSNVRRLKPANMIIGIATVGFSLVFENILGTVLGLYYYIKPEFSVIYIVIASIFIYPPLNIIYTLFLPRKRNNIFVYTLLWIGAMMFFEYFSIIAGTVVLTGWKPFPWSVITYIVTYTWINLFYAYLQWNMEKSSENRI